MLCYVMLCMYVCMYVCRICRNWLYCCHASGFRIAMSAFQVFKNSNRHEKTRRGGTSKMIPVIYPLHCMKAAGVGFICNCRDSSMMENNPVCVITLHFGSQPSTPSEMGANQNFWPVFLLLWIMLEAGNLPLPLVKDLDQRWFVSRVILQEEKFLTTFSTLASIPRDVLKFD